MLVCWERQKLTLQRESRRRECCYEKTTADASTSGASAPKFWAQIEAKVLFGEQTRRRPPCSRMGTPQNSMKEFPTNVDQTEEKVRT